MMNYNTLMNQEAGVPRCTALASHLRIRVHRHTLAHRHRYGLGTARTGYTLLELMLALALLGALMTVAWSLMGTYRDAESRGWKLSQRTQIIRTAREWLQGDLLQLAAVDGSTDADVTSQIVSAEGDPSETAFTPADLMQTESMQGNANRTSKQGPRFIGDATGFSATIVPPLDPLPFFERLMSDALASDRLTGSIDEPQGMISADNAGDDQLGIQLAAANGQPSAAASPWPAERVVIEYRLIPMASPIAGNASAANVLTSAPLSEIQFMLVRRERVDHASAASDPNVSSINEAGGINPAADRVLTAQDLYRQTDDAEALSGAILRESKLNGITQAGFKYGDGVGWRDQWDSGSSGMLPSAIALSFDFPAAADMQPPTSPVARSSSDLSESPAGLDEFDPGLSFADSALASESVAEVSTASELGLVQGSTSQVQVVVRLDVERPRGDTQSQSRRAINGGPR